MFDLMSFIVGCFTGILVICGIVVYFIFKDSCWIK